MLRIQDFNLAPGASVQLQTPFRYLKLLQVSGAVDPVLLFKLERTGVLVSLRPGQGVRQLPQEETAINLTNPTGSALVGTFVCGAAEFEDSRLFGLIEVIDKSSDRTLSGSQLLGASVRAAAGAGVFSMAGVSAPPSQRLALRGVTVSSSTSGDVYWGFGTGVPVANYVSPGNLVGKFFNGALSVSSAPRWTGTAANSPPLVADLPGLAGVGSLPVSAGVPSVLIAQSQTPLVLAAGNAFWVHSNIANRDVSVGFDCEVLA